MSQFIDVLPNATALYRVGQVVWTLVELNFIWMVHHFAQVRSQNYRNFSCPNRMRQIA